MYIQQKHLGVLLDKKQNFHEDVKEKIAKATKFISLVKKFQNNLPKKALLTTCDNFVIAHLDIWHVAYDQPNNETFSMKLEKFSMLHWSLLELLSKLNS